MSNLIGLFENFNVSDGIDILIVTVILYRFFSIIQGTRAVQVLVGTGLIATMYWISLSFELYSVNWLLKNFIEYFFIILIILFQEQIRSALAEVGQAKIFGKKKKDYYDSQIEEVVTACSALSRERTGALIILKETTAFELRFYRNAVGCQIHSDIIYTIFQSSSPLHDGAVILYENKIQAAGCFLPLSKNIELDRHYGTRHRAALGVSEVSDALVVIVSEERGKMSICFNGRFKECDDEKELRKQLRVHLYSAREDLVLKRRATDI